MAWSAHAPGCGGGQGSGAYNPCMFHAFRASLQGAVTDRLVLLANHVLAAEPAAGQRLATHSGRRLKVQFEGWPARLPPVPDLALRVTSAGLLEWCVDEPGAEPDLRLRLDASNPLLSAAQWASGERPRVDIQGDAQFAADAPGEPDLRLVVDGSNPALRLLQWRAAGEGPRVAVQGDAQFAADLSWLMDNLRWDVQDDLARLIGPAPAHEVARVARLIAAGLRGTLAALSGAAARGGGGAAGRAAP